MGPSGSGKTYTALVTATALGRRIAVIDTEHGSASKYADFFEFDVCNLTSYSPENYIKAIQAAEAAGYDVLIIDSLSHAWAGPDGVLEFVDRMASKYKDNRFSAWRDATPLHNRLIQAIIAADMHVIATLRTKTEWALVQDERGKTRPERLGTAPVQRDGIEYEFDIVAELDAEHRLRVTKTRCCRLDGYEAVKPGKEFGTIIKQWLEEGTSPAETKASQIELKKMVDVAQQAGLSVDQLKQVVIQITGKSSSADLTSADVQAVIKHIYRMSA